MPEAIPRGATGMFSSAVDTAPPQMPPIAIPKRARTARNWEKVVQNAVERESAEMRARFNTSGMRRPKRSEARPKTTALWNNQLGS